MINAVFFSFPEYDNLFRLGITDAQNYLKRRFKRESIVYLKSCCAGPLVVDNLEAAIDEALSSGTWLDVMVGDSLSTINSTQVGDLVFISS